MENIAGDATAVLSLLFDNVVNLVNIQGILVSGGASEHKIVQNLYFASVAPVVLGNVLFWSVFKYRCKLQVSIPFGIDAPTCFFVAAAMLDIYNQNIVSHSSTDALKEAWLNAKLMIMTIGLTKLALTVLYWTVDFTKHIDPKIFKACLNSIGLSLLGMNNLIGIFAEPMSGLVALFVFLMKTLPKSQSTNTKSQLEWIDYVPDITYSVACALPVYYILANLNVSSGAVLPEFYYSAPAMDYITGGFHCYSDTCQKYLLQSVSYAFLVFGGGYSVITDALEIARAMQRSDDFSEDMTENTVENERTNKVVLLMIDAICTIFGAFLGSLIQTTPYIGYTTYRKLNAGTNYSLYFAALLLIFGATGAMGCVGELFPQPILKPIFLLIAINLAQDAFGLQEVEEDSKSNSHNRHSSNYTTTTGLLLDQQLLINKLARKHNQYIPAMIMALFPVMADLMSINGVNPSEVDVITVLSNGFVFTSILWGLVTLFITQRRKKETCIVFAVLSLFSFLGIIHSWNGEIYVNPLFWDQDSYFPTSIGLGYLFCALLSVVFVENNTEKVEDIITAPLLPRDGNGGA